MGWGRRGNRAYYYRAERVGGRVVKEYVPPLVAEAALVAAGARKHNRGEWRKKRADPGRRSAFLGAAPTPVERLPVDRVGACRLQANDAEGRAARTKGLGVKWATSYQDRVDRANRRLLAALEVLAQVRKLAVPVLQVNIAKAQVNVPGPPAAPD